jgi:uncharacterized protein (TIGR03437 family)
MIGRVTLGLAVWMTTLLGQQPQRPPQQYGILIAEHADTPRAAGSNQLVSGVPASFSFPKGNGLSQASGDLGFQIVVPDGSTTLQIDLVTTTPAVDIDLYVRYGKDVDIANGLPVADYRSEGLTGNESLLITTGSTPPLRAGTYYLAFGVFNPVAATGTVTATVGNAPNPPTPPPVVYAWQTDWNAYGTAIASFLQTFQFSGTGSFLTHPKFDGKQVVWQGTVNSNPGPSPGEVGMSMPAVQLKVSNGASGVLISVYLVPKASDLASWNPQVMPKGRQISFRATLGESAAGGDSLIFLAVSGVVIAFVNAVEAELLGQPPAISQNGVASGASFQPGLVPGSWTTISGTSLASVTDTWDKGIVNGKLPTVLDGVSVSIGGKPAYIQYVSPNQINVQAPDVGLGSIPVTVTNSNCISALYTATSQQFGPAFFLWTGKYAVATRTDFTLAAKAGLFQGQTTVPAKPGDVIILWGTGFGPTSPAVTAGIQVPADRTYSTANPVTVTVGNAGAQVFGAALAPGYAGLYQIAIQIPNSTPDGDIPIKASIGGLQSPDNVFITVQH